MSLTRGTFLWNWEVRINTKLKTRQIPIVSKTKNNNQLDFRKTVTFTENNEKKNKYIDKLALSIFIPSKS